MPKYKSKDHSYMGGAMKGGGMSKGNNAGTITSHSEESAPMLASGGKKYSSNNPAELTKDTNALASILK